MNKQRIILLLSGAALLLIGFFGAAYPNLNGARKAEEAAEAAAARLAQQTGNFAPGTAVVPPYVPEAPATPAAPKTSSPNAVSPTAPAEVVQGQDGRTIKIINISIGQKIIPDKVYLNRGDGVRLDVENNQTSELTLISTDQTRGKDIIIAPGAKTSVSYDTSRSGDLALICQTCTPPAPLVIRVLAGRKATTTEATKK
jgi:hypothetical protein